jgi:hypothetical protein
MIFQQVAPAPKQLNAKSMESKLLDKYAEFLPVGNGSFSSDVMYPDDETEDSKEASPSNLTNPRGIVANSIAG